jgi:hypothetical protein
VYFDPTILTGIGLGALVGSIITGLLNVWVARRDRLAAAEFARVNYDRALALSERNHASALALSERNHANALVLSEMSRASAAALADETHNRDRTNRRLEVRRSLIEAAATEFDRAFAPVRIYAGTIVNLHIHANDPIGYKLALDEVDERWSAALAGHNQMMSALIKPALIGHSIDKIHEQIKGVAVFLNYATDVVAKHGRVPKEELDRKFAGLNKSYADLMDQFTIWMQEEMP